MVSVRAGCSVECRVVDTFLQTFHNVDVLVANLIEKPDKTNNDKILRKYKQELQQTKDTNHGETP